MKKFLLTLFLRPTLGAIADLEETPPGLPVPRWQALLHLANHGTDHRAQMLRILADLGAPTFEQDLLFHVWKR